MIEYVRVTVDDVDYELPQEITVTHYGELMRRMSLSETEIEKAHDVICVMLGIPYTIIREFEKENEAFLIKIGQVAPSAPKPVTTKKDEE